LFFAQMSFFRALKMAAIVLTMLANGAGAQNATPDTPSRTGAKRVLLIGLDGFGAYAWKKAEMPRLKALAAEGAISLEARAVLPSVSAPNWASHLLGAGPELHGFTTNSATPSPPSLVISKYGRFPGIYGLIRDAYPDAETGVFYDWNRIGDLLENKAISTQKYFPHRAITKKTPPQETIAIYEEVTEKTAIAAAEYIATKKPFFTFVYLGAADETGHMAGHDTPEYYATLKKIDAHLGALFDALKAAGIEKETVVIVVSDHGGVKKGHGEKSLLEVQTPWIISGPGVKRGHVLKSSVVHYDTAPTIAYIFGLTPPQVWRGRPVSEAFAEK
jgi:predicted AlkP superfamily pyrophosphatase or phosphodiesterase